MKQTTKHLGHDVKINGSNLSHVLAFIETYIITNIEITLICILLNM